MPNEKQNVLAKGMWVALTLKPGTAPLRCYVGKIQAIDHRGVRITLVDWLIGVAASWDFFVPFDYITSALVATEEHDIEAFGDAAAKWQKRCAEIGAIVNAQMAQAEES